MTLLRTLLTRIRRGGAGALLGVLLAVPAAAQPASALLDDELLVILEVRLDNAVLSPGLLGYQSPARAAPRAGTAMRRGASPWTCGPGP